MAKKSGRTSQTGAVNQTARGPTLRDYSSTWDAAPAEYYSHESPPLSVYSPSDWTTDEYRTFVDPLPLARDRSSLADVVTSWIAPRHARNVRRFFPSGTPRGPLNKRSTARLVNPWGLVIPLPGKVAFCIRRKLRRQALFAFKVAGRNRRRSPGRGGSYRRNQSSSWRC